jgi:plastocyanin domain-containing protein
MVVRSPLLVALLISSAWCSLACSRSEAAPAAETANGNGIVRVTVDGKGFTPSSVNVKKGSPLSLSFLRTTDDTCATAVVFPDLGLTKELPLNTAVDIEVPTDAARTLTFQCGMGMFKSRVVVR